MEDAANHGVSGPELAATEFVSDTADERPESMLATAVRFAWAILLSLVAGFVLQLWVVHFLGSLGPRALYVRSIYMPIGFLVIAVTEGLSVVGQVTAGIACRNGERAYVLRLAPTFAAAGVAALGLVAAVFVAASNPILNMLEVPAPYRRTVVAFALTTIAVSAVGLVPVVAGATLRGVGSVRTASVLGVASAALSAGSIWTVNAFTGAGLYSVPLGTMAATLVTGTATFVVLYRAGARPPRWQLALDGLRSLWAIAVPVGGTNLLLSTVTLGYLWVLRNSSPSEIAGFSVGQTTTFSFTIVAIACGSGAAIAVNMRPGTDRIRLNLAGYTTLLRVVLPAYVVVAALAFAVREPLSRALAHDPVIAQVTLGYLTWVTPTLILFGATLAILTYLEQIGRARTAFVLNVVYFAVLLAVAFCLRQPVSAGTMSRLIAAGNTLGFISLLLSTQYLIRRAP